ncbi:MAG: TerB family tellurite resistance protein [Rhodobiaceae bacterium]|mgnify:FL=1|nr:TerB family tellurite resistance protein [Rhodobiaceae bacterium]
MLDSLRQLFAGLGQAKPQPHFEDSDHRLAIAALLVHAVAIDGVIDDVERAKIRQLLAGEFSLSEEETRELVAEARAKDNEAVDLYNFTSVLKRALDAKARVRCVEMLWEIVYADGEVHEFEDNLVWRVAELLAVSREDRLRLKRQVARARDE